MAELTAWAENTDKLVAILDERASAEDIRELLFAATFGYEQQRHVASARAWSELFDQEESLTEPFVADHMVGMHRYNAACSAALAAGGQGADAGALSEEGRSELRLLAVQWLCKDLEDWNRLEASGDVEPDALIGYLSYALRSDPDLAAIRDPEVVAQLPDDEREACETLWQDFRDRRKELTTKE